MEKKEQENLEKQNVKNAKKSLEKALVEMIDDDSKWDESNPRPNKAKAKRFLKSFF
jgi:hypothetical protein